MRCLPWTLWRMATVDLLRLVTLTAAIVVTIAAFGAMIPQLAKGRLGPAEGFRFMLLAVVPMLQYALPFASGFASTLVYHRMAQDNEVLAAHAGGLGHRAVLAPALGVGLLLAVVLSVLSEAAIHVPYDEGRAPVELLAGRLDAAVQWPGQFVNVTVELAVIAEAVVVPPAAVQVGQRGYYVYVVKADSTVELRLVRTGIRTEHAIVIEDGLKPGDRVVTEGQLRLRPGARVAVRPSASGPPPGRATTPNGPPG